MAIVWKVAALLESVTAKVMFPRDKIWVGNVGGSKPGAVLVLPKKKSQQKEAIRGPPNTSGHGRNHK